MLTAPYRPLLTLAGSFLAVTTAGLLLTGGSCPGGADECEINGYYGDGICDGFCPQPDPDCVQDDPDDQPDDGPNDEPDDQPDDEPDDQPDDEPDDGMGDAEDEFLPGIDPSTPRYGDALALAEAYACAIAGKDAFEQAVADGDPDPVQTAMNALMADPDVTGVELSIDGATIMAQLANGIQVGVMTDERDRDDWMVNENAPNTKPIPTAEKPVRDVHDPRTGKTIPLETTFQDITCDESNYPQSSNACVVLGFQETFDPFNEQPPLITDPLMRAGYSVKTLSLKTPADLQTLQQELPNCGVLYIQSHGNVKKNFEGTYGNNVTTEIELDLSNPTSVFDMMEIFGDDWMRFLSVDSIGKGDQAIVGWSLTPEFFAQFEYPNSFVYIDTCNSDVQTGGNQLSDAFRNHGAGGFIGWQGPIANGIAKRVAAGLFDGLAPDDETSAITGAEISTSPPDPGAFESYVPSVQLMPAVEGVTVRLSISGTDGFSRTETGTTDASGHYDFASVPGGSGGVTDTITVVVGGADNSDTVYDVILNDPALESQVWSQPWSQQGYQVADLRVIASDEFNLICNNQTLTETTTVVKF